MTMYAKRRDESRSESRKVLITLTEGAAGQLPDGEPLSERVLGLEEVDKALRRHGTYRVTVLFPKAKDLPDCEARSLMRILSIQFEQPIDLTELSWDLMRLDLVERVETPEDRFAFV